MRMPQRRIKLFTIGENGGKKKKMNRAEKRKIAKKIPGYRDVLNDAAKRAVDDLEKMFQKQWLEDDETLNEGEIVDYDDGEDEIYNA